MQWKISNFVKIAIALILQNALFGNEMWIYNVYLVYCIYLGDENITDLKVYHRFETLCCMRPVVCILCSWWTRDMTHDYEWISSIIMTY